MFVYFVLKKTNEKSQMDSPARNTRSRKRAEPVNNAPVQQTRPRPAKKTWTPWVLAASILTLFFLSPATVKIRELRSPLARAPLSPPAETEIILYFFGQDMDWNDIASSPYTFTLICFGDIPGDNIYSMKWPGWCKETDPNAKLSCLEGIEILHKAGKKVGISIGGGDSNIGKVPRIFTTAYEHYVAAGRTMEDVTRWAVFLAGWVKENKLDGIDFDNEEAHTAWTGGVGDTTKGDSHVEALADRDGLDFMGKLQVEMRKALGPNLIFAVSLQPPFYCPIPPVPDPGATNPITFPVVPLAPWYVLGVCGLMVLGTRITCTFSRQTKLLTMP